MGSVGKKIKKVVKKIARPKVLLPLAALAIGGPMLSKALAAKGGISGALLGQAGTGALGAAAPGSLMGSGMVGLPGVASTSGLFGTAGKLALGQGTLSKGIMYGLKNPLTKKGLMTYGAGAGALGLGMGLLGDKEEGGDPDGPTGAKAQSMYDSFLMSGKLAGYTDDEINTIYKPYGDMYYGDYQTVNNPNRTRKRQFPGTNYPIYAANGGRIGFASGKKVGGREKGYKPMASNYDKYDDMVRELDDALLDRQQEDIIEQMREMGEFDYANGGRAGYAEGDIVGDDELSQRLYGEMMGAQMSDNVPPEIFNPMNPMGGPHKEEDIGLYDMYEAFDKKNKEMMDFKRMRQKEGEQIRQNVEENKERIFEEFDEVKQQQAIQAEEYRQNVYDAYVDRYEQMLEGPAGPSMPPMKSFEEMFPSTVEEKAMGGRIGMNMGGGIMQAPGVPQGMELDYRNTGGFIPMGGPEKADDVPAMLSKNEFVMTADAVRGMGGGDVNLGAQKMYDLMNNMEAKV